ncbi:MAG TPA: hypothetical protein VFJ58_20720 [Armatimonadota bacterium]|nr:hypothetical protein [Armatimonadota bacterium]
MSKAQVAPSIEKIAKELARENGEADENILQIRWFPNDKQLRLIMVHKLTPPLVEGESVAPFYFGADHAGGVPYQSAIAMVSPDDDLKARLPDTWGTLDDSVVVWEQP